VERCVLMSEDEHFPQSWLQLEASDTASEQTGSQPRSGLLELPLDGSMALDEMEKYIIEQALERAGHNVAASARLLGTTRQTLRYRIEKHAIGSRREAAAERDDPDR